MDKMKLQELCQKRRWRLPEYTHSWVVTGHEPRFTASVTVNGSVFQSPDAESRSVKEAQNKAAAVAFETLSAIPSLAGVTISAQPSQMVVSSPAGVFISARPSQTGVSSQAGVSVSAQPSQTGASSPAGVSISAQPSQTGLSSQAGVSISAQLAQTGVSSQAGMSISAQPSQTGASSQAGMSISAQPSQTGASSPAGVSISVQPSQTSLLVGTAYKAKLQELCQKQRWDLPQYTHSMVGSVRGPCFVASVTVNGSVFECPDAESRSIKEAQNKAAAVAFETLSAALAADAVPSPSPSLVVQSFPPSQSQSALLVGTTYKVRLQELCQKRRWDLPQYTHSKVESAREPRFIASVTINGSVFKSLDAESRSIKEAQNKAAAVAFEMLFVTPATNVDPSPPPPSVESISAQPSQTAIEAIATYKSQLEVYAQERKKELPTYTTVPVGLPHAPQCKATVEIDGLTFEAEHVAAEVAPANLRKEENSEHNSQIYRTGSQTMTANLSLDEVRDPYKTWLQEYVQKRKQPLPVYTTVRDPDSSLPFFLSMVEVFGRTFKGGVAKSKKQAEMKAAKLALDHIEERKQVPDSSSSSASLPMNGTQNSCSSIIELKSTVPPISLSLPTSIPTSEQVMPENQAGHQQSAAQESIIEADQESKLSNNLTFKLTVNQMPVAQESKLTENQMPVTSESKPLPDNPLSELLLTPNSIHSDGPVLAATKDSDNVGIEPSLMSNRIQVFPTCPGLAVPNGAMALPFSDDSWMAVSLDNFT